MRQSVKSALGLLTLLLAPMHAYAAGNQTAMAPGDRIEFIALPYLNAFHYSNHEQPVIISQAKHNQNLSDYQWRITATSIPEFRNNSGHLKIIDAAQASGPRLAYGRTIIIPLPTRLEPVSTTGIERKAFWVHWINTGLSRLTWQSPSLTPVAEKLAIAEQKRKARLAKRMADRAFYFGYDTNNDALK